MPARLHLFAAGSNGSAQLGLGHRADVNRFAPCVFACSLSSPPEEEEAPITALASGAGHSLLVRSNGHVYVTGTPSSGQLGPQFPSSTTTFSPGILDKWHRLDLGLLLASAGLPVGDRVEYTARHVGCAWTTSFISFSRSRSRNRSEGGGVQGERAMSDIVLAFGTNDFGELGCGGEDDDEDTHSGPGAKLTHSQTRRVRVVRLPGWNDHLASSSRPTTKTSNTTTSAAERETLQVQHLALSQRHIIAVCLVTLAASGGTEQRVYGWGAARHGQLSPPSSVTSAATTTPTSHNGSLPASSSSSSSSSANPLRTGNKNNPTPLRRTRSIYPAQFPAPVLINLPPLPASVSPTTPLAINSHPDPDQITHIALGARHTILRSASGHLVALGDGSKTQLDLPPVPDTPAGAGYERVACTWNGTVALLLPQSAANDDDGRGGVLLSTGSNTHGQLGRGATFPFAPAPASASASASASAFAGLAAAGGTAGQSGAWREKQVLLPVGKGRRRVGKLVCGSEHVLVLLSATTRTNRDAVEGPISIARARPAKVEPDAAEAEDADDDDDDDDVLVGWGWNEHGNLALGHAEDQLRPIRIPLPREMEGGGSTPTVGRSQVRVKVRDVWAGCGTTWVLLEW